MKGWKLMPLVVACSEGGWESFPSKLDFHLAAPSLTCEGRTGWASEVSIHVYEGRYV